MKQAIFISSDYLKRSQQELTDATNTMERECEYQISNNIQLVFIDIIYLNSESRLFILLHKKLSSLIKDLLVKELFIRY